MTDVWSARISRPASSVPFTKSARRSRSAVVSRPEVVEGGELGGEPLGAGQRPRISGGRGRAGRPARRAGSAPRRRRRRRRGGASRARPGCRRRRGRGSRPRSRPRGAAAAFSGVPARTAQRSSSASAAAAPSGSGSPASASRRRLLAVQGMEGDAVVAEVRVDARDHELEERGRGCPPPPSRR